jgi:hypothetical protein
MATVMDDSEAVGAKRDATIKSRQQGRGRDGRWTMAFEGVGDVRWRSTKTAMVGQGGSETTARIELKSGWLAADVRRRYRRW